MPQDAAALLKREIKLSEYVAQHTTVTPKANGKFMALCPFHDNTNSPAFSGDDAKGFWKCFVCDVGGTVIDFWLMAHNMDPKDRTLFGEAIEGLSREHGVALPERPKQESGKHEIGRTRIRQALERVAIAANDNLFDGKDPEYDAAYTYIVDERKMSEKLLDRYMVGMMPEGTDKAVEFIRSHSEDVEAAIAGGILVRSTEDPKRLFTNFAGRLVVPIRDRSGGVIGFGGREVPGVKAAVSGTKWVNPSTTPVYDKSRILYGADQFGKGDAAVIVEGYFDAIAVTENKDIDGVGMAVCGVAFTQGHLESIQKATGLTFVFDGDEAGRKALTRNVWVVNKRRDAGYVILEGDDGKVDPWELQFGLGGDEPRDPDPAQLAEVIAHPGPILEGAVRAKRAVEENDGKFDEWVANGLQTLRDSFARDDMISIAASRRGISANSYNRVLSGIRVGEASVASSAEGGQAAARAELSDPNTGPMITRILQMTPEEHSSVFATIDRWSDSVQSVFGEWFPGAGNLDTDVFNRVITGGTELDSERGRQADLAIASLMPSPEDPVRDITRSLRSVITLMNHASRPLITDPAIPKLLSNQLLALRSLSAMAEQPEYQPFVLATLIDVGLDVRLFERRRERAEGS